MSEGVAGSEGWSGRFWKSGSSMLNCRWGRFLFAPLPNLPKVNGWFFGREKRFPVFFVDPDRAMVELFDLGRRVGFGFFPFLEFACLRLGCDVVLNLFCFRTALGCLVVVGTLFVADFEPIDRNFDFFNAGFDVTGKRPKLLLCCLVAGKLFCPLFELGGFLKPNPCPLGLLLLIDLFLLPGLL